MGEDISAEINAYLVKGTALGFVDGDCKRREDRKLLSFEKERVLLSRGAVDSRKVKNGGVILIRNRAGRDELALEYVWAATVSQYEARTVTEAEFDVHISEQHVDSAHF